MSAPSWRLLDMGAASAAANMAVDDALLRHAASLGVPTLRLYGWKAIALSFGYFIDIFEEVDVVACRARGVEQVRRPTGGGVVVHDASLTYTLAAPPNVVSLLRDVGESYRLLGEGVVRGLSRVGIRAALAEGCDCLDAELPDWCFARTTLYDVVANGVKLAGAAQRRHRLGLLHQGYVALGVPPDSTLRLSRKDAVRAVAASNATRNNSLAPSFSEAELRAALVEGFAEVLDVHFVPASLTDAEIRDAERLRIALYEQDDWNFGDRTTRQRLRRSVEEDEPRRNL